MKALFSRFVFAKQLRFIPERNEQKQQRVIVGFSLFFFVGIKEPVINKSRFGELPILSVSVAFFAVAVVVSD